jgi:nucleoside-diphosphate-sugar epimerase
MKVLLTGAAGFVGSHLAQRLLEEGYEVLGVDNFLTGQRRNLTYLQSFANFSFLEADASQPLALNPTWDWILHLACPASPPHYLAHPLETLKVSAEGSRHLLELARSSGAVFFLASTSEVYGDPQVHPQPETYWGHVNPIGPRSVYDEAKRYAEALTQAYHRQYGVKVRVARIFNTYGPRMDPQDGRVVSNFIVQALQGRPLTIHGNGQQTRSFQYISDLVEGIWRLMHTAYSQPVNLGNPAEFSILELAQLVSKLLNIPLQHTPTPRPIDDPQQRCPQIELAQQLLDWTPQVPLTQGLQATIKHFREAMGAASNQDAD